MVDAADRRGAVGTVRLFPLREIEESLPPLLPPFPAQSGQLFAFRAVNAFGAVPQAVFPIDFAAQTAAGVEDPFHPVFKPVFHAKTAGVGGRIAGVRFAVQSVPDVARSDLLVELRQRRNGAVVRARRGPGGQGHYYQAGTKKAHRGVGFGRKRRFHAHKVQRFGKARAVPARAVFPYTKPWSSMASATFTKPAKLAPFT